MPTASPTLFLDMDGVVARSSAAPVLERLRPVCVARLDGLVRRTGARVVISSTWRITCTPERIRGYLASAGYSGEIHSVTPVLAGRTRGAEIQAWLDAHPGEVSAFAILDDWPLDEFRGLLAHLVQTDYDAGLTNDDCVRVEEILTGKRIERARAAFLAAHMALPQTPCRAVIA